MELTSAHRRPDYRDSRVRSFRGPGRWGRLLEPVFSGGRRAWLGYGGERRAADDDGDECRSGK